MPVIPVNIRDDEEETASPKKSLPSLRIYLLRVACGTLLIVSAAMAFTRVRPPRSNWTSIALVQTEPAPCFAAIRTPPNRGNIGTDQRYSPAESRYSPSFEQHPQPSNITASASQQPHSRPILAAVKNKALFPNRFVKATWSKLKLARKESSDRIFRQNTEKRWDLVSALASNNQPQNQPKC